MSQQPRFDTLEFPSSMRPSDYLRVDERLGAGQLLLVVSGEADYYTADTLRDYLGRALTPAARSVVVDVSGLRFCDLSGLDALDGFCAEAVTRGLPVTMQGMSPLLTRLRDMFSASSGPSEASSDT